MCIAVHVCVSLFSIVVEDAVWEAGLSGCKGRILQQSAHLQLSHIREEVRQSQIRRKSFWIVVFNRCVCVAAKHFLKLGTL